MTMGLMRGSANGNRTMSDTVWGGRGAEDVPGCVGKGWDRRGGPRGGYCRLQMPLRLALAVRKTVAGRMLGALEGGGGGGLPPPLQMHPWGREGGPGRIRGICKLGGGARLTLLLLYDAAMLTSTFMQHRRGSSGNP